MRRFLYLPTHAKRAAVATLVLLGVALVFVLGGVFGWFLENNERLKELEPRISRLNGLIQSVEKLEQSNRVATSQLAELTYPASLDSATGGASLQRQVRGYMEGAGMSVTGSQVLTSEKREGFEVFRVNVTATGTMESLEEGLIALEAARPLVFIGAIEMMPARTRRGDDSQNIVLKLTLSAMRLDQ